jgi:hypothetical protein
MIEEVESQAFASGTMLPLKHPVSAAIAIVSARFI